MKSKLIYRYKTKEKIINLENVAYIEKRSGKVDYFDTDSNVKTKPVYYIRFRFSNKDHVLWEFDEEFLRDLTFENLADQHASGVHE